MISDEEKLRTVVQAAEIFICYDAFGDEPDPRTYITEIGNVAPLAIIPPDKEFDPKEFGLSLLGEHGNKRVVIFIPGRAFDYSGTRHGRGGGWYDRLLSGIPKSWVRVGVTHEDRISKELLERKNWDEPVDYLLVEKASSWEVKKTGSRNDS